MKTSFDKFMASNANNPIKVEMALIDDIEKKAKDVLQVTKDFNDKIEEFKKFQADAKLFVQGRTQQSIDLLIKLQDANEMAKDLGVPFNITKYQSILDKYYAVTKQFDKLFD